jgi:peptidoglycan/xylan/chitin deacetylase (PgdA/CDA1 family)
MDKVLLVVNYHYIRKIMPSNGIYPITPEHFTEQLDLINANGYDFISIDELDTAISTLDNDSMPSKSCLITFDDGLLESFETGYSILKEKGIPAVFYAISDTIEYKKIPHTHKIHYLRSNIGDNLMFEYFREKYQKEIESLDLEHVKSQYPFDNLETSKVKYLLNFVANYQDIDEAFNKYSEKSESDVCEELFMSKENIIELSRAGCLGTHGKNHVSFGTLDKKQIKENISDSINYINNITGKQISSISYPFGEQTAISKELFESCRELNLSSGFTMERGLNNIRDIFEKPYQIKRYDTTEIFGGKYEMQL